MKSAEGSGRTVEEAIREALRILGAKREDVDLMVLDEGSRGVLGLGSREARVRLTLLSEEGGEEPSSTAEEVVTQAELPGTDAAQVARGVTSSLIGAMGFRAVVQAREEEGAIMVSINGPQLAPLIGRHGQTLSALELLVGLIVSRRVGRRVPLAVDAERYRERRREALVALATRTAARVRRTGRPAALEPMSPAERRVVHTTLAVDADVTTNSEGEGADRHVVIAPRTDVVVAGTAERSRYGPEPQEQGADGADEPDAPEDELRG